MGSPFIPGEGTHGNKPREKNKVGGGFCFWFVLGRSTSRCTCTASCTVLSDNTMCTCTAAAQIKVFRTVLSDCTSAKQGVSDSHECFGRVVMTGFFFLSKTSVMRKQYVGGLGGSLPRAQARINIVRIRDKIGWRIAPHIGWDYAVLEDHRVFLHCGMRRI